MQETAHSYIMNNTFPTTDTGRLYRLKYVKELFILVH